MLPDTCAVLWLAEGSKRLSAEARQRIGDLRFGDYGVEVVS